jgi:hypothetical protein
MIISNGEPFIKLEVATQIIFLDELIVSDLTVNYFEEMSRWVDLYILICGVCNIFAPTSSNVNNILGAIPKKINGMCKAEVNFPSYQFNEFYCAQPNVNLKTSSFIEGISSELTNCPIKPMDDYINYDNHFRLSYVHLPKLLTHAKDLGITIDAYFVSEIVMNDAKFSKLKEKNTGGQFDIQQAVDNYRPFFNGVNIEIIADGCASASAQYDRKVKTEISEIPIHELSKFVCNSPPTSENISQFKNFLPKAWQDALFNPELSQGNIENRLYSGIIHSSENLELLNKVVIEYWEGKDPNFASKEATNFAIQTYVKDISPETSATLAKNIAMIIRPDKYK